MLTTLYFTRCGILTDAGWNVYYYDYFFPYFPPFVCTYKLSVFGILRIIALEVFSYFSISILYVTLILHCNILFRILFCQTRSLSLIEPHSSTFNCIIWFTFEFWMLLNNVVECVFWKCENILCWETYYYFIRKKYRQCLPFSLPLSLSLTVSCEQKGKKRPGKFATKLCFITYFVITYMMIVLCFLFSSV